MWTVKKTQALIEDLYKNPCLWNNRCSAFKNRIKKGHALNLLAFKYIATPSIIEKKIQSLKNQWRREHRKIIHDPLNASTPKWFGYESLLFLREAYESRKTSRMTFDGYIEDTAKELSASVVKIECDTESNFLEDDVEIVAVESSALQAQQNNKPADNVGGDDKEMHENLAKRDEFAVYGEHIANKLRHSGRNRLEIAIAQHKIDDICFKLTMGELHK